MLSREDLKFIISSIKEVNKIQKENENLKTNIPLLSIKEQINHRIDAVFIDSSYITGIVGPYSYIYARAVGISKNNFYVDRDFILLPDTFFKAESSDKAVFLTLNEIAEIISKRLEYKIVSESKEEFKVIDGSIFADSILYDKGYSLFEEDITWRYDEFMQFFESAINLKILSIAKRILGGSFLSSEKKLSDFMLLLSLYPEEEFYTVIFRRKLPISLENRYIKFIYFRARRGDHIYRLEASDSLNDEDLKNFIASELKHIGNYPKMLKLAHNKAKITNKEKFLIEQLLKRELGYSKAIGWETK